MKAEESAMVGYKDTSDTVNGSKCFIKRTLVDKPLAI